VIVGNYNVKKVERQSASACFTWDTTWTLCNACNPTFFDRSGVPHVHVECASCLGHTQQKKYLLKCIVQFFLKGVVVMFWHDFLYVKLLYCVTNIKLVWTWNKAAVADIGKKCRLYPTFPYIKGKIKYNEGVTRTDNCLVTYHSTILTVVIISTTQQKPPWAFQPAVWGISCLVLLPSPCNDSACTYHSAIFVKPQQWHDHDVIWHDHDVWCRHMLIFACDSFIQNITISHV